MFAAEAAHMTPFGNGLRATAKSMISIIQLARAVSTRECAAEQQLRTRLQSPTSAGRLTRFAGTGSAVTSEQLRIGSLFTYSVQRHWIAEYNL